MGCAGRSPPGGAGTGRPRLTVGDIFRAHGEAYRQSHALSEEQRKAFWWLAHSLTVLNLQALDLWPPRVPVPDISARARAQFLEASP